MCSPKVPKATVPEIAPPPPPPPVVNDKPKQEAVKLRSTKRRKKKKGVADLTIDKQYTGLNVPAAGAGVNA